MPERDPAGTMTERRILVYGVTGSGKSTAATRLGAVTRLPVHLADELTWLPGWVPVDTETQRETFAAIAASDAWVLDTAYSSWLDLVLPRCELVVALDYPRWRSLARLLRRTAVRIVDRRPVCNGNVETLRGAVSRDSIIAWHFRSFTRKRDRVEEWSRSTDVAVLRFRRPADAERWLRALESAPRPAEPTP
jgi:adenylate kinase family enzyme